MKEKVFGIVTFLLIVFLVFVNTLFLHSDIEKIYEAVNGLDIREGNCESAMIDAEKALGILKKKELFMGLTVNHEDLSDIKNEFSELLGYLSVDDAKEAFVVKNRLKDSLSHLRRLSGFNIDAII